MKILQVIPYYAPAWSIGGTVTVAHELSTHLAKNGHDVTVCTSDILDQSQRIPLNGKKNNSNIDGVNVIYFKNFSLMFYRLTRLSFTPGLISFLRNETPKFDVIHLHQYRSIQNIIAIYYAKKYGVPYFLHPHGSIGRVVEKQLLKFLFDVFFGRFILGSVKKIFALTQTEALDCGKIGVSNFKIEIVPNGINKDILKAIPEKGTFRNKYSINGDRKFILYLGRIHRSKGLILLIHAMKDLLSKNQNIDLFFIGPDDRYQQELIKTIEKSGISNHVRFFGFLPDEDKLAALVDAEVFITPIFYGFPITFVESMACGTPIITTNKGDVINTINNNSGFVVDYDAKELSKSIEKILEDKKLRMKLSQNGIKMVLETYNWNVISRQIERYYLNAVKTKNKSPL